MQSRRGDRAPRARLVPCDPMATPARGRAERWEPPLHLPRCAGEARQCGPGRQSRTRPAGPHFSRSGTTFAGQVGPAWRVAEAGLAAGDSDLDSTHDAPCPTLGSRAAHTGPHHGKGARGTVKGSRIPTIVATVVVCLVVAAGAIWLFMISGTFNVAASSPTSGLERWVLNTVRSHSIRAAGEEPDRPRPRRHHPHPPGLHPLPRSVRGLPRRARQGPGGVRL